MDSTLIIDGLKAEPPMYLAASADVSTQTDTIAWWKSHETELPNWANACRLILLVQPPSAASEQVVLNSSFSSSERDFSILNHPASRNHLLRTIFSYNIIVVHNYYIFVQFVGLSI